MLKTFLVFYGYLSIYFGWSYYIVVFLSFAVALYFLLIRKEDLFKTSEVFIKTITTLGIVDLILSSVVAFYLTLSWLNS
ncbi:MAG: hypothetical protein GXN97_05255 [Aquificae bacterium]|nr:hypothetical protein [Aquificota bacterium]